MKHHAPSPPGPQDRAAALTAERHRKMAESAHAYVRGSTVRFYEWLERSDRCQVPDGPPAWICGDCHAGNLGPVGSADGRLAVQIRDLDQTVIGNPAHDLLRLGLSLAMAARGANLPGVTTALMLERMVAGYQSAFARPDDDAAEAAPPHTVRIVMREAAGRSWKHLADERIEGQAPSIPLGRRFWPLAQAEQDAVHALFATPEIAALVTTLRGRGEGGAVRVMDAAYWRKGCSSLGRLRLAVLVAVEGWRRTRHCLVDVKEATAPAAPSQAAMPDDPAVRVVTGARHLSPFLGERMVAGRLLGRPVFVRELMPQDLKLEIETLSRAEAMEVAEFLSTVVGRAHARQMDATTRRAWVSELARNPAGDLEAPSWLWAAIVELIGTHERAYLEHCRLFALQEAA